MTEISQEAEDEALLHYATDPVGWCEDFLGVDLWGKQKDILRALITHRSVAVASCHGVGKSFIAGCAALWRLYNFKPGRVVSTAPTDRQVKEILWSEIRTLHSKARYPLGGRILTTAIELDEGWSAIGFTTRDDPTRFQGHHSPHMMVLVDEAAGVSENVRIGIAALLASGDVIELEIGNPTDPTSGFAKKFQRASVAKFAISAFDTPNFTELGITIEDIRSGAWEEKVEGRPLPRPYLVTPAWVRDRWEVWCGSREGGEASPLWMARVLGQFPHEGPNQLLPLEWILAAGRRFEDGTPDPMAVPRVVAVDVARFGDDETVVVGRAGDRYKVTHAAHGHDTMETAGHAKLARRKIDASEIRVDVIGVGAGVVDRLAEDGEPVVAVNVSESPIEMVDETYRLRDEIFWNLRKKLQPPSTIAIEADDILVAQLSALTYKIPSDGKVKIESKDSMKARGLGSPDRADAVAMAAMDSIGAASGGGIDVSLGATTSSRESI